MDAIRNGARLLRCFGRGGVWVVWSLLLAAGRTDAAVRYVWSASPSPSPPYTTWATAARDVQTAVNASTDGDTLRVRDGVYAPAAEIVVDRRVRLESESGPAHCLLSGSGAHRVVHLAAAGSVLCGFTVTNGAGTEHGGGVLAGAACISNCWIVGNALTGAGSGGGVFFASAGGLVVDSRIADNTVSDNVEEQPQGAGIYLRDGCTVRRCVIERNVSSHHGGGVFAYQGGIVETCLVASNEALQGGGLHAFDSNGVFRVLDSTVSANTAIWGGGLFLRQARCVATNMILFGNTADLDANYALFVGGGWATSELDAAYVCAHPPLPGDGNLDAAPLFVAPASGDFRLSSESPCRDAGSPAGGTGTIDLDGCPRIWNGRVDMGAYEHQVETPAHYASPAGAHRAPFETWARAATNIQDAVDAAVPGDTVWVAPGDYAAGGRAAPGLALTNRVCITNAVAVRSSSGPDATRIHGAADPGTGGQGPGAARAVWAGGGATVVGFTLRDGWTLPVGDSRESGGGGAQIGTGALLSNCVVRANAAGPYSGGGVYCGRDGRMADCTVVGNTAGIAGGVFAFTDALVERCAVSNNTATSHAGGVYLLAGAVFDNGLVARNGAAGTGGGLLAYAGGNVVRHTTVADNEAGDETGGLYLDAGDTLLHTVVWSNRAPNFADLRFHASATVSNCCAPGLVGTAHVDADPQFASIAAGDYRLRPASPCVDAATGGGAPGAVDLDRFLRLAGTAPDLGAYESHFIHFASPAGSGVPPYVTWETAATVLQDAVDAAHDGDTVLVAEGDYADGGRETPDARLPCRLVLDRPVEVRAAGAQASTRILATDRGELPRRGAYVGRGVLCGFTVAGGTTDDEGEPFLDGSGGGLLLTGSGVVSNCLVTECSAALCGGGALLLQDARLTHCRMAANNAPTGGGACVLDASALANCLLDANRAQDGAGVRIEGGRMVNCTLSANAAENRAGGVSGAGAEIANSVLYGNEAPVEPEWSDPAASCYFACCCTSGAVPPGPGNLDADPLFVTGPLGPYRLRAKSPCIDRGDAAWMDEATDMDGFERFIGDGLDIGAFEFGTAALNITNSDFGVDAPVADVALGGTAGPTMVSPCLWTNVLLGVGGGFAAGSPWLLAVVPLDFGVNPIQVWGENASGVRADDWVWVTRVMRPDHGDSPEHFVSLAGGEIWPYTNWLGATRQPQRALDAALAGDRVRVAAGVYAPSAQLTVTNALDFVSQTGPAATVFDGGGTHRVLLLSAPCHAAGFTLRRGGGTDSGGGLRSDAAACISNCWILGNSANDGGAGAHLGAPGAVLADSYIAQNTCTVGAASSGGGVRLDAGTALRRCRIEQNRAYDGGGVYLAGSAAVSDTLVSHNTAFIGGGLLATGSGRTEFAHVTVAQNLATLGGGVVVSWDAELVLRNVIVQWNNAMGDANVHNEGTFFAYDSLLPGAWPGSGCIDGDPRFVDVAPGGFRLRSDSPCIDAAGYLAYPPGSVDVAGLPRVLDGDYDYAPWPDMGAREYHPLLADTDGDGMADGWEYWRFLDLLDATDARLDFDDDGCDNGGEYAADTNPWNAASCLRIAAISTSSGVEVGVPATSASRRYALERCVRLGEPWTPVDGQADVVGTGEALVLRDAATPTGGCYRVRAFTLPPAP